MVRIIALVITLRTFVPLSVGVRIGRQPICRIGGAVAPLGTGTEILDQATKADAGLVYLEPAMRAGSGDVSVRVAHAGDRINCL